MITQGLDVLALRCWRKVGVLCKKAGGRCEFVSGLRSTAGAGGGFRNE